ncbi:MAG: hypothetical protein R3E83_05055 [Burkholderiaceae bacterium]
MTDPSEQTLTPASQATAVAIPAPVALPFVPVSSFAFRVPVATDPILDGLVPSADAPQRGMWLAPMNWPLLAIHASLLPDGRVVSFGTPNGGTSQSGRIFDIWDPTSGTGRAAHWQSPNAVGVDSFCASAAWIGAGRLMVAGGNVDRATSVLEVGSNTSTNAASLSAGRWYGTMITLADGRALMVGGGNAYADSGFKNPSAYLNADGGSDIIAMTPEVYSPGSGWTKLSGATSRRRSGRTRTGTGIRERGLRPTVGSWACPGRRSGGWIRTPTQAMAGWRSRADSNRRSMSRRGPMWV